ncbi:MAG: response regulator [Patescibacteria group bacterium]
MNVTDSPSDKTILIVEDDVMLRDILIEKVSLNGFKTIGAEDGEEGLRLALEKKPDLVLLDIMLPKMDGITVLKKLRASPEKDLPVFILTNSQPDDYITTEVAELEPTYYLIKANLQLEDLMNKIRETLNLI